jgi:hypothetical protein
MDEIQRLCVGRPGFVAFAAVAPMIPMTVPIRSAVTSRRFGGSRSGSRGSGSGLSVTVNTILLTQPRRLARLFI